MTLLSTNLQQSASPDAISEWTKGSGVDFELAEINLEPSQYGIWEVSAVDPRTGAKCNRGQRKTGRDNPKYITFPRGRETDAIPLMLTKDAIRNILVGGTPDWADFRTSAYYDEYRHDLGFYRFVLAHPDIPLYITEGAKKAACLLSYGYLAVALPGVWNGQKEKMELKPVLSDLCTGRKLVYLVFDSDFHTKPQVWEALQNLGSLISDNGTTKADIHTECKVVVWDSDLGKGVDDLVVQHGAGILKTAISEALTLAQWERQFPKPEGFGGNTKGKPNAVVIGKEIAGDYRDTWIVNDSAQEWMQYQKDTGVWKVVSEGVMESQINTIIEARGIMSHSGNSFIANVMGELKRQLRVSEWNERTDLLPFTNCCVEIATGKTIEHSPGHRFTWCLPRAYNPLETSWNTISEWFDFISNGNEATRDTLICYMAATLKGHHHLQKFIHLIGSGGTGKTTYTNLQAALIGDKNTAYLTLPQLNNEHSLVDIQFKRLLVLADQDAAPKDISNFKNITGGDRVSARRLYKEQAHFTFRGMVTLTSNHPIFRADIGTWLTRRQIVVNMSRTFKDRRDLMKEFEPELGAFTQYLLSIPDEHITAALRGDKATQVTWEEWENMMSDSIVAFTEEWLVSDLNAKTAFGDNQHECRLEDEINPFHTTLYGAYSHYTKQRGQTLLNSQNFRTRLEDTLRMHPDIYPDVERKVFKEKGKSVRGITGIRLRRLTDDALRVSEVLMASVTPELRPSYTSGYTSEPLQDKEITAVTPFSETFPESNTASCSQEASKNTKEVSRLGVTTETIDGKGVSGSEGTVTASVTAKPPERSLKPGDVVWYTGENPLLKADCEKPWEIVKIRNVFGHLVADLKLDDRKADVPAKLEELKLAE